MSERRQAAYAETLLKRRDPDRDSPFLHLGHWSGPPDQDLQAAQRRLDAEVLALAEFGPGMSVLDVGCGIGGTLAHARGRWPDLDATGLNLDPAQLAVARAEQPGARFVEGDACAMPFPDASFDRVLSIEAAFHFPSRRRFLREAARVLKPGGRLALSDIVPAPGLAELEGPLAFALECVIDAGLGPWPSFWSFRGWRALAAEEGLTVTAHVDATAATAPSYPCFQTERDAPERGNAPGMDAMTRAVSLLGWLHTTGRVRMVYVGLLKEGALEV